jgi:hypothetical protein
MISKLRFGVGILGMVFLFVILWLQLGYGSGFSPGVVLFFYCVFLVAGSVTFGGMIFGVPNSKTRYSSIVAAGGMLLYWFILPMLRPVPSLGSLLEETTFTLNFLCFLVSVVYWSSFLTLDFLVGLGRFKVPEV